MTASITEEARRLVADGWKIFPLQPGKKEPLPNSNGWHGAKTDAGPWERNPDYNIGLPMALNGLVALDIDGQWGREKLAELEERYGKLPATRTHRHGDGFHLVYRLPAGVTLRTTTLAKDVRKTSNGESVHSEVRLIANGYLVAPPSVHPDGELYDLEADTVIEMPAIWVDAADRERRREDEAREMQRRATPRILDRPGDDYNAQVNCHEVLEQHGWARGKTDSKGTHYTRPGKTHGTSAVVYHDNGKAHIYSSSTSLPDGRQYDAYGLLARLDFNGDFNATTRHLVTLGFGDPHTPVPPIDIAAGRPVDNTDELLNMLIDWPTFWKQDHTTEDWLVWPIIPTGRSVAIYAPGGTGKSILLLWLAARAAAGLDIFGRPCPPRSVLYLDYEMTAADLAERLDDMGFGPDTDFSRLHYAQLPDIAPLDDPAGAAAVVRLAELVNADLVVIDTLARAIKGDENEADTIRTFYRLTGSALKADGRAVIRADHAGKDNTKGARGTSAKRDDVDVVWHLTPRDQGALHLKADKRRVAWVADELELLRDTDGDLGWHLAPGKHETWPAGTAKIAKAIAELGLADESSLVKMRTKLRSHGISGDNRVMNAAIKYWRTGQSPLLLEQKQTGSDG